MSRYVTERVAGVWQVRDTFADTVSVYGPGARGAGAAESAATHLNASASRSAVPPNEVRTWRKAHSLSQAQLAKLLGVQPLAVLRWENGSRTAPPYLSLALKQLERDLEQHPLREPVE
jgi:DNA-binding transcriptional regulator YiaG